VRVDAHIKVEDSTSGDDTDGDGVDGEGGEVPGGEGGGGEEGLGVEGGLVLHARAMHVPDDGGAPRRSTPADRATRA